jgi:cytochrome c biogenesis protein CcmG, thiol:disulfide interchange protein DsbE
MSMKNVVAMALVLVVTLISGAAQDRNRPASQTTAPDAKAILKQVAETYKNLRSYHFEGRYTWEHTTEAMGLKDKTNREELFVNAAIKPDRTRIESKNTIFSVTTVSDGKTNWVYAPAANEYTKTDKGSVNPPKYDTTADPTANFGVAYYFPIQLSHVTDQLREAKIIGKETLEIEGRRVDCLVIEANYVTASTRDELTIYTRKLWIDKSRNIVLRDIQYREFKRESGSTVNSKMTYIFTVARVGEPIPETLFTFAPPEGAKEVAKLKTATRYVIPPQPAAPQRDDIIGKDAIAFALKDTDGNQVDLQTLKGKVVLLDFWASWCGPCVAELPHIENLHKDFKNQGLVTLGVNNEDVEVARAFVKQRGYTFTTLVDEGKEVSKNYGVSGIPQVFIIGREGKVKWHTLGYSSGKEVELRSAVEKVLKGVDPPAPVSPRPGAPVSSDEEIHKVGPVPPEWRKSNASAPKMVTLSESALSAHATKRAQPDYPTEAKAACAQGPVQVEITVSESGNVIEAKAIAGHEMLRDVAAQAAKQWEFIPVKVSGVPVKMRGILVFIFVL